jgi:hypothetical protein
MWTQNRLILFKLLFIDNMIIVDHFFCLLRSLSNPRLWRASWILFSVSPYRWSNSVSWALLRTINLSVSDCLCLRWSLRSFCIFWRSVLIAAYWVFLKDLILNYRTYRSASYFYLNYLIRNSSISACARAAR